MITLDTKKILKDVKLLDDSHNPNKILYISNLVAAFFHLQATLQKVAMTAHNT